MAFSAYAVEPHEVPRYDQVRISNAAAHSPCLLTTSYLTTPRSPPDHLTLAADPSTTTSLTTDSWTPAPLVNGTPTGAQPARASDLPFYSVRHGLDLPVRIADSRHRATRVLFVVIVCLGLSVGGASVTVLLISKVSQSCVLCRIRCAT